MTDKQLPLSGRRLTNRLFRPQGIHAIVDGQFGSTGKGVLAAWLARKAIEAEIWIEGCIYSGGPNSGHTFYHGTEKHVLKQLPTTAVAASLITGKTEIAYLSAGAIIRPDILFAEAERYPKVTIYVHPQAAVVTEEDAQSERVGSISAVAGTRSGTGACLARKIKRDPLAVWKAVGPELYTTPDNVHTLDHAIQPHRGFYFMEVSQGFSLGLNSDFYPKVTSRECTVMQGLADARIPPSGLAKTYMSLRTFPIRVGNIEGHSSGEWYDDQTEIAWSDLGVTAELTTVTQRERRVATFSFKQLQEAIEANDPDWLFINFLNYLPDGRDRNDIIRKIKRVADEFNPKMLFLGGYDATSDGIIPLRG